MKLYWVFSTFAIGGPQRRFVTLATAFGDKAEHVITAMDGNYEAEELLANAPFQWRRHEVPVVKSGFISGQNIKTCRAALREVDADVLLTSNWGTIEWKLANTRLHPTPHIHFEDGFGPDEAGGKWNRKRDFARRVLFAPLFSARTRNAYICPSYQLARRYEVDWSVGNNLHLIPNGVDLARFSPSPTSPQEPLIIGSVGALRKEKRFDRLIDAFGLTLSMQDARLLIVGDGPEREALEAQVRHLGIHEAVEFAGARDDIADQLRRMSIYALTSDTEQMPISLVEAMASGLPVVSTHVGDVAHMLPEENRPFIHATEDVDGLARSLHTLLINPSLRHQLSLANRRKAVADYDFNQMLKRYAALIGRLAKPRT